MDSGLNIKDFEYTVHRGDSIVGIKDGKEYPITQDEWNRANPKHIDIGCKECTYAEDSRMILLYVVSRELREEAEEKPRFIGKFNLSGWTGHSSFYLFKCKNCGVVTVDYPHGYANDGLIQGLLYLRCDSCDTKVLLYDKKIYSNEGMEAPPTFLEMVCGVIKSRWRMRRT